jgi:hypothetical protein
MGFFSHLVKSALKLTPCQYVIKERDNAMALRQHGDPIGAIKSFKTGAEYLANIYEINNEYDLDNLQGMSRQCLYCLKDLKELCIAYNQPQHLTWAVEYIKEHERIWAAYAPKDVAAQIHAFYVN